MIIQNASQRARYQEACKISTEILRAMYEMAAPGVYPIEIDQLASKLCRQFHVQSSFYPVSGRTGKYGYQACIYLNDVAVHGIPSKTQAIKPGDLLTIDFGIIYDRLNTDQCLTVGIERVNENDMRLLEVGRQSVLNALEMAVTGNTNQDLGYAMESTAREAGFDTIKEYVGHGIGKTLHEHPEIPAFGKPHRGTLLDKGMVICVECQVTAGSPLIKHDTDGWSVKTQDGKNAVMFEYMAIVDEKEPIVLTDHFDWELVR